MKQFCEEVLRFLQSEYSDGYGFRLDLTNDLTCGEDAELVVYYGTSYRLIVSRNSMKYLFILWKEKTYIEERKQYAWQKELIDIIEGS